jgi:hypothetical protein
MAGVSPERGAAVFLAGAAAGIALLSAYSVPWWAIARFALLVCAFFFAGRLLAPRELDGAEAAATALTMGMATSVVLWAAALLFGLPPRGSFVILAALATAGASIGKRPHRTRLASAIAAAALACAAAVAWTQFGNGREAAGSGLSFANTYAREALFHCAIAQEMRHSLVVHLPAGVSLPYHVGYHVLAALTAEATGASMLDVSYRLLPVLLVPGTVLAAAGFAQAWGGRAAAAAAGAFVLFFADDLSWVFGITGVRNPAPLGSPAWDMLLGAPVMYALHHNRGFLLGTLVFFVTLALLGRYLRTGGGHQLATGSLLGATLVHCKVSYFLILAAALGVTVAIAFLTDPGTRELRARAVKATVLVNLIAAPLLLAFALGRPTGDASHFAPFPAYIGVSSLVRLGIFPDWETMSATARNHPLQFTLRWLPLAVVLFIGGTLGIRAIGIRELVARTRSRDPLAVLTTGVVTVALAVGLALYTPPDRFNVAYFWAPALLVLAVLSGMTLASPTRITRPALLAVMAIFALPGTIQFLWVERSVAIEPLLRVPPGVVEAANYLSLNAEPGDVVLEPDPASSVLAALAPVRPVMAWADWVRNSLGKTIIRERVKDVRAFFGEDDVEERRRILGRYRVRWVWSPHDIAMEPVPEARRVLGTLAGDLWQVDLKAAPF